MRCYKLLGRGRDKGVGCHDIGCEGREQADGEGARGGEEERAGCVLQVVGGEECGGVDGFGVGMVRVGIEGVGGGGWEEEVRGAGLGHGG